MGERPCAYERLYVICQRNTVSGLNSAEIEAASSVTST